MSIFNYNDFLLNEAIIDIEQSFYKDLQDLRNTYQNNEDIKKIFSDLIEVKDKDIESKKLPNTKYLIKPSNDIGKIIVGNNEYKIGKFLKILFPDLKSYEIEDFTNTYKAYQKSKGIEDNFKLVKNGIEDYYCMSDSEIEEAGHILHSCMVNKVDEVYELFELNSNVELLILEEDSKLIGRSLVWTDTEGNKIMDRIYYKSEYIEEIFKMYARKNGWYYRATSSIGNRYLSGPNGERVNDFTPIIKLEEYKPIEDLYLYPYIDTFTYLNVTKGELCNFDVWGEDDVIILLDVDTDTFTTVRNFNLYLKSIFDKMDFVEKFKENYKHVGEWHYDDLIKIVVDYDKMIDYVYEEERRNLVDNFNDVVTFQEIDNFLKNLSISPDEIQKHQDSHGEQELYDYLKSFQKHTDKNIMEEFYKHRLSVDKEDVGTFLGDVFMDKNFMVKFLISNNFIEEDTKVLANRFMIYLSDKSRHFVTNDTLMEILASIL